MKEKALTTNSPAQTRDLGCRIASQLWPNSVLLLQGDLGAGKTVFSQGVGEGLKISEQITSPTFTIVQEYSSGRLPLYHADLYRVGIPEELTEIGFEEYYLREGVVVIEWPDRLEYLTPEEYLQVRLTQAGQERRIITLTGAGEKYEELVDNLSFDA